MAELAQDLTRVSFAVFVPGRLWTMSKERTLNHFARAELVREIRGSAKFHTMAAMRRDQFGPFTDTVTVEFLPYQATGRMADTANHLPPCKAVLDGMVDAGLIPDDDPRWVISQTFYPPVKAKFTGINVLVKRA